MKYIFVHGGPGLNSNPERHLLSFPQGQYLHFWDEPSVLRNPGYSVDNAYENWLSSLSQFIKNESQNEKVTIIAHSFGAFAINDLLPSLHDKVAKLILIAPILNLLTLDSNILDLAIKIQAKRGDLEGIKNLYPLKADIGAKFDNKRFHALLKAISDEDVLPSYWYKKDVSSIYNYYFAEEKFNIDFSSFKNVRDSITHNSIENKFQGEVLICFGQHDPIVRLEQDYEQIEKLYPLHQLKVFENSGHYPHIEENASFKEWILNTGLSCEQGFNQIEEGR